MNDNRRIFVRVYVALMFILAGFLFIEQITSGYFIPVFASIVILMIVGTLQWIIYTSDAPHNIVAIACAALSGISAIVYIGLSIVQISSLWTSIPFIFMMALTICDLAIVFRTPYAGV